MEIESCMVSEHRVGSKAGGDQEGVGGNVTIRRRPDLKGREGDGVEAAPYVPKAPLLDVVPKEGLTGCSISRTAVLPCGKEAIGLLDGEDRIEGKESFE